MNEEREPSVVISGASSGIGRACAVALAKEGFLVFAGVRKATDGESLRAEAAGQRIEPIELDVTKDSTIAAAVEKVSARLGGRGLDGLVNNAGIATPAPVEYVTAEVLRRQFDVNVFGLVSATQAFLPLIRKARGRIVNIGSIGDRITIPFGGALCATKSAVRSLSEALRLELRPFGVHVSLVEPGAIRTPAVDKTLGDVEVVLGALPPEGLARYEKMIREFMRRAYARESHGSPPEVVAQVVRHALTARRPRLRYHPGASARTMTLLPQLLPDRALDQVRLRMLGMPTTFGAALAK
jgi:NAD(P)-dependent dehydrogenase (short-subunit alcohol dehydrogenase family)